MKHYIFLLSVLITICSYGQEDTLSVNSAKKYGIEIGVNLFSSMDTQKDIFLGDAFSGSKFHIKNYKAHGQMHYFPGVFLKGKIKRNIIRFSIDCIEDIYKESHSYGTWYNSLNGKVRLIEYKLGYERTFGGKKIKPFICSEFTARYSTFKGTYNYFMSYVSSFSNYSIIMTPAYSISIGAGVKYEFIKNMYLSYEFSFQGGIRNAESSVVQKYFIHFNPVRQFGLSYVFEI